MRVRSQPSLSHLIVCGLLGLSSLLTGVQPVRAQYPACQAVFENRPFIDQRLAVLLHLREGESREDVPDSILVRGVTYRDLIPLNQGTDSRVYLAWSGKTWSALKVFNDHILFQQALKNHRIYKHWLPSLIAADRKADILVMKFRDGVPLHEILGRSEALGISERAKDKILELYQQWRKRQRWTLRNIFHRRPLFDEANVVYSFADRTFYLIDAF